MLIREAIRKGMIILKTNNIEEPNLKSRLLMQFILNKPRQYLLVHDDEELTKIQEKAYLENIEKITKGIPLQHITHSQEFMKMNFYVNEDVLIPRADTEILVEEVINIAKKINAKKILDLCTGSGAIAVSLAKYIEDSQITAIDISEEALRVAKLNARNNEVEDKITFIKSDLFENVVKEKYDIIVSNPPYIKREDIPKLQLAFQKQHLKEVQKEPNIALDGGNDGLDFYREIISEGYEYLKFKGYMCLEIGYDQKKEVIEIIEKQEKYSNTYSKKDFSGNDRIVVTQVN